MADPKKPLSREEVAAVEVGHTTITRGLALAMLGVFIVLIALVPLIQHVLDLRAFQAGDRENAWPDSLSIFQQAPSAVAGGEGVFASNRKLLKAIADYESDLEDESVLTKTLLSPVQEVLTKWLGVGNEQAYIGKEGYLFYRPGFDHVTGPPFLDPKRLERVAKAGKRQPDPVKAILDFKEQLEERGIQLIVWPVSVKPSVAPQGLGGHGLHEMPHPVPMLNPSLHKPAVGAEDMFSSDGFLGLLMGNGVETHHDLFMSLRSPDLYLKTDTHWKPQHMEALVGDLARYVTNFVPARASSGYTRGEEEVTSLGDIAAMLQLPPDQTLFPPETVTIHPVKTAGGRPWRSREDSDVLLLGDSFANIYSVTNMNWGGAAGLAEQLSFHLQRPVDKLCINDNGSYASRELLQAELRAGKDRLAGKKVVIWEFAARELSLGDWKLLDMSLGEPVESREDFYVPESGTSNLVGAVVAGRSFVPRPGSVPYKDHICVLHLKELSDLDGTPLQGQAAVYTWSMRDNLITPAGKVKPGERITLRLQPWHELSDKLGSINKSEIDDDAFLLAEFCWGEPVESPSLARTIPFSFYIYMLSIFTLGITAILRARSANGALNKMKLIKIASGSLILTAILFPLMKVSAEPASSGTTRTATPSASADSATLGLFTAAAQKLEASGSPVLVGRDGWLFMSKEVRHLGLGEFWGPRAADVSRAKNPGNADPLPTILDLNQQLKDLGIELVFMPVPPKAAIYADKAVGADPTLRVDVHHAAFLAMLKAEGVNVIDLAPLFLKAKSGDERVYCQQDTHWARLGMEIAATEVAAIIKAQPWFAAAPKLTLSSKIIDMPLEGDLLNQLGDPLIEPVTEKVQNVTLNGAPLEKDAESPILILGDSHTLFLHDGGDMHAVGSGFPDLLALQLGTGYDLIGNRGSGVGSARLNLARAFIRNPAYRSGKKVVIWLFAGRDFTETSDGTDWKPLPMKRN
jgi:hypothetical protein